MFKTLPTLSNLPDVRNQIVVVRAALNVPIKDGNVTNKFRIMRALPTINFLRQAGARVVVLGHVGREKSDTFAPVYEVLRHHLPVSFVPHTIGEEVEAAKAVLKSGEVLLLENVRQDDRETENDLSYAEALATGAVAFVNDAFADSHRSHASLAALATLLPTFFGRNFMHEYEELSKARTPVHPSLFILGGAKFDTKMPLVDLFVEHYDNIFIGGALANDVFKARGYNVGQSLVSDVDLSAWPLLHDERLLIPVDVEVEGPAGRRTCSPKEVCDDEKIFDAGSATIALLAPFVDKAATILWNGPLGNFEVGFGQQTADLAKLIAQAKGYAIVGGGDTIAAIESLGCQESFGFMSTAGGAMLTYLELGTLPAIDAADHG